jgi:hypothetical protein
MVIDEIENVTLFFNIRAGGLPRKSEWYSVNKQSACEITLNIPKDVVEN